MNFTLFLSLIIIVVGCGKESNEDVENLVFVTPDKADNFFAPAAQEYYVEGETTITLEDSSVQSLGIMLPGNYTFGTAEAEIMEILSGELEIKLPNENWKTLNTPETFNVPANSSFDLKITTVTDYCCSYIK